MNMDTRTDRAALRQSLLDRLGELQAEVDDAERAARRAFGAEPHDQKDEAARRADDAVDRAEERRDLEELTRVRAALHRLDAGTYGDCIDCGAPIPLQRLRVQPAAERCAACQAALERLPRR